MLEKLKKKYYRYGVIVAADGEESENAKAVIEKYGVKMVKENSIMYKMMMLTVPKLYQSIGNVFVFKAKNQEEAIEVLKDFSFF